jgi:hypothetical protein
MFVVGPIQTPLELITAVLDVVLAIDKPFLTIKLLLVAIIYSSPIII